MRIDRLAGLSLAALIAITASAVPAHAAGTLDQEYTVAGGSGTLVEGVNQVAQVFTAGITGQLDTIDFRISSFSPTGPDLTMTIKATSGGLPTGAGLATSTVARSATSGTTAWVTFTFSSPITVVSGTQYAIVLSTTATTGNGYSTEVGSTSLYSGGNAYLSNSSGSSWGSSSPATSQNFRTYVTSADSGGIPPVMQQFGMPSSGTCDAAAPVMLNWGGAGSGGWGNSWAQWANGGNGGAVCTRTLVYSNAAGRWIVG